MVNSCQTFAGYLGLVQNAKIKKGEDGNPESIADVFKFRLDGSKSDAAQIQNQMAKAVREGNTLEKYYQDAMKIIALNKLSPDEWEKYSENKTPKELTNDVAEALK